MFGYVTVAKEQLTETEYDTFCAYYCGVCKATGRNASQLSRLGLSYDITFLALVLSSLADDEIEIASEHCAAHHIKKKLCVKGGGAVDYAASVGVILNYLKLKDDLHDDKSLKALLGMLVMRRGYKKAVGSYAELSDKINAELKRLGRLERERCGNIDEAADAFAKILEALFLPNIISGDGERRILAWLGYNLGRWIYIIDAYNDMESDFKKGLYNPFLAESGCAPDIVKREKSEETELSLTFTLENIASAFELLSFKRNKDLVGKIIYTSLKQKQSYILNGKNKAKTEGQQKR